MTAITTTTRAPNATPGTLAWFSQHEWNLASRDFVRMITAGNPRRKPFIIIFAALAFAFLHLITLGMLAPALSEGITINTQSVTIITGTMLLTFSLMMSQALEMVTRAFYARSDLDLILSSPVSIKRHFAVRVGTIAFSTTLLSLVLFAPALNILAWHDGSHWLAGYPMFFGMGAIVTTLSLMTTVGLFKTVGAKKTRLIAQIIAAVVGAAFIIGIQLAAISSLGSVSRIEFFSSQGLLNMMPSLSSLIWLPAKGLMGEAWAFLTFMLVSLGGLGIAISAFAPKFGEKVLAASNFSGASANKTRKGARFANRSQASHLRNKEWRLLLRDHWLVSQSLMQILYLIPPAFMLWRGFSEVGVIDVVVVPILVMAAGQLAGGLAWLAISGEDAPDLVATAPVPSNSIIRAKIEAVLGAIAIVTLPFIAVIAWINLETAAIAALMIAVSTISATMIQLWFRSQAKRSNFRRRQVSSKLATVTEAFSSILWAGTAGMLAVSIPIALCIAAIACLILITARMFRPQ